MQGAIAAAEPESLDAPGSLEGGATCGLKGLSHYLIEHKVRLPEVFVEHVRTQREQLDDHEIDDSWWRGFRR
ncbi:hypothetical protein [Kribbella italica]|uniref:Uncharacterized protein n=1 Tax=Kribbella italica TaxID=1540520 RepID=A0A7W9MUJ6_9ACTN|nr:hypothetical protein [Kribbella italica]MBB5836297.1 hypothetical protein [Kribbella italica]